ncbi:MAG TPA: hypothetical protein ENN41_05685 [Sediminispirochaeta sp.]|nr:hypothetical protein [Sediminispirochaeta sp.]
MQLEDSNGKIVVPQSAEEINAMIDRLGRGVDHLILSEGELFVQCAGSGSDLVVQYGDPSGLHEASETASSETVKELFGAFFRRDESWRTMVSFERSEAGGASTDGQGLEGGAGSRAPGREKSLKEELLDSVKREVKRNVSRTVGRGVRDIFRKFR